MFKSHDYFHHSCQIEHNGNGSYRLYTFGKGNKVIIKNGTKIYRPFIRIKGYNNTLVIGKNCIIGTDSSFWMEGNDIKIAIGDNTTFTEKIHINAQEDGSSIVLGSDCMLSNNIIIRTSDSHPIYDTITKQRINKPKPVVIGNHVWIAPKSTIMKGANIADGCIIGSNTMVSKSIPSNCLAVGMPARVVKENVMWTRDSLF